MIDKRGRVSYRLNGILGWLFLFFVLSDCFHFAFIHEEVQKMAHWMGDAIIVIWILYEVFQSRRTFVWAKEYRFILIFQCLIIVSIINAFIIYAQTPSQSFRVIYPWTEYLFFFFLIKKKANVDNIFYASLILTVLRFLLWGYIFSTADYDLLNLQVREIDEEQRGVIRLSIPGGQFSIFVAFWCLGKYTISKKVFYLLFFILCFIFLLLGVSRQHIVAFSIISMLFLLKHIPFYKKVILIVFTSVFLYYVLPRLTLYQQMYSFTQQQMYDNDGGRNDVRVLGATYYLTEFKQPLYTKIFGNCKYHAESQWGEKANYLIRNRGFVLSDFGIVGIYIYFGIAGVSLFLYMLYWVWKKETTAEYDSMKYYIYFLYAGSIASHSLELSTFTTAVALYLLSTNSQEKKKCKNLISE